MGSTIKYGVETILCIGEAVLRIIWIVILVVLTVIAAAIIDLVMTMNNGVWNLLSGLGVKPLPGFNPDMNMVWAMFVGFVASMVTILFALIIARSIREKAGTGW